MVSKEVEKLLLKVQKPGRYVGGELNEVIKDKKKVDCRFAFCFPDTYEIGMSNLGLRILYGATAEKIEAAVKSPPDYRPGQPEILHAQTLQEAVRLAKRHTVPGDIVTLSPACAAVDQFKNFMVRGEAYKTLVRAL